MTVTPNQNSACDPPNRLIFVDISHLGLTKVDSRINQLGLRIYTRIMRLRLALETRNLPCRRLNVPGPNAVDGVWC